MRNGRFTASEMAKAGPLYNPKHMKCVEAKHAMQLHHLVQEVFEQAERLNHELITAKKAMHIASVVLYHERLHLRYMRIRRIDMPAALVVEHHKIRHCELDVLAAHDMVWAAQRAIALHITIYGPQPEVKL